jgi:5-formyltetrahydrofolate cyclo-ligase
MVQRADVRRQMRARRRALSQAERSLRAHALADQLTGTPLFRNSRRIAAYLPVDGEADPLPLIQRAWNLGKTVYLPVLVPFNHNRLWFAPLHPDDPLVINRFGIAEPARIHRQRSEAIALDLVLTPLVAFDVLGNRLGMGGGFYDRTFAFLHRRRHWLKPRLVGLAYGFQQVVRLPRADWDVPLYAVATDEGVHRFRTGNANPG